MTDPVCFRALSTFVCEETRSTYVEGSFYTVRPGNDLLAGLMADWLKQGTVEVVELKSKISGQGKVSWP